MTDGTRQRDVAGKRGVTRSVLGGVAIAVTALVGTAPAVAGAATVGGIATVARPGLSTPVTSGGSATQFTLALPAQAHCSGDTATGGFHVYSYLIPAATDLHAVSFVNHPSSGFGLVDPLGTYYGPVNTAIGTGQIVSIPNNFSWAPLVTQDGVALAQLLYTGAGATASGVWEAGLVSHDLSGKEQR